DLVTTDANTLDPERHYDAIAVTASLPLYVPVFQQALNVGGRLFLIVGEAPTMEARLIRRLSKTDWHTESLFETVVPALINAPRRAGFVF
ncbi:MAG: protein-L-isoaspartate O-methyltransferase, partial [Gammaproteobacteria bacterium]